MFIVSLFTIIKTGNNPNSFAEEWIKEQINPVVEYYSALKRN